MTDPGAIKMLVLDVDGVLTDGSIMIDDGGVETKRFNVKDGLGITTWLKLGLEIAVVTRRSGGAVEHRMAELGVHHVIQGSRDKAAAIETLATQTGVRPEHMAFIGDDWPDMAAMRVVGYPIAVSDAAAAVRRLAAHTTMLPGGRGAVREAIEHLLGAKGLTEQALGLYR